MKRLFSILGGGLGLLLLVGMAVALFLSVRGGRPTEPASTIAQAPVSATPTEPEPTPAPPTPIDIDSETFQSPLPPPAEPALPTPDSSVSQPPPCQFEKEVAPNPVLPSQLDQFVFSEPTVIFSQEAPIEIIEWLPDNQGLLVHVRTPAKESIEVVDTTTGQTHVYASNLENANQIHWVADEKAVVYTEHKTPQGNGMDQYGLWLARGEGSPPQLLLEDASQLETQASASQLPPAITQVFHQYDFSFDPEQWRYEKYPEDPYFLQSWAEWPFAALVNPDGSKAVFYGVPWLYLVDLKTNQPCEVELGKYMRAYSLWWSPDGKLLAMLTTTGYSGELLEFNEIAILDTTSGEIYRPDLSLKHLHEVIWLPDSRHIITMGPSGESINPNQSQQIILIDTVTKNLQPVLPAHSFGGGQPGYQLALSPNGQKLSVKCSIWSKEEPLILKDQVCLISIQSRP